jgi:hypothetical protein
LESSIASITLVPSGLQVEPAFGTQAPVAHV